MAGQNDRVRMEAGWKARLADQFSQPYMEQLRAFLLAEKSAGRVVYPPGDEIFNAFNMAPWDKVRVVILGQDPYHGPGQAHGLCFSVKPGIPLPPSLRNIFREVGSDVGAHTGACGCLVPWARQGVLLLNSVLTVERGRAAAHEGKGWERFTDRVIEVLSAEREGLVFMLWGSYAQRKGSIIDGRRHLVLRAPHPSPLSASRGFFGCQHFSRANDYLLSNGQDPVDWAVPDGDSTVGEHQRRISEAS